MLNPGVDQALSLPKHLDITFVTAVLDSGSL